MFAPQNQSPPQMFVFPAKNLKPVICDIGTPLPFPKMLFVSYRRLDRISGRVAPTVL